MSTRVRTGLAISLPIVVIAFAYVAVANVAALLSGTPGVAGGTGPTGTTGPTGNNPAAFGVLCGPTGIAFGADANGVRVSCGTSTVRHVSVLGGVSGLAADQSRVLPVQAGGGALVITATGGTTALYIENVNVGPPNYPVALDAFGTVSLQNAQLGLPMQWVSGTTGATGAFAATLDVKCPANSGMTPITGSCSTDKPAAGAGAAIGTQCLWNNVWGRCVKLSAFNTVDSFHCVATRALTFNLTASVLCMRLQ